MHRRSLAATALLPIALWAIPAAAAPAATVSAKAAPADDGMFASDRPRIGAGLDLGVPDGATVSVVYRPFRALRAHIGISHNAVSLGERAGVTLAPFAWLVSPTLSLEYGRYAEGNANPIARIVTGDDTISSGVLDRVGYQYANAQLGLEVGRTWFTFYLHAGVSRVTGTVHNINSETMSSNTGTTVVSFNRDPDVRLWTASARIGFVVYLAK
ncbi:MAG TPA: hypothetical protein VGC42_06970 [Kofleriaceae bacterium]